MKSKSILDLPLVLFSTLFVLLLFSLLPGQVSAHLAQPGDQRHPDPPGDPPVLSFIDPQQITFYTDQDDGWNCVAELIVIITADWGPGHSHKDIWIWEDSVDMDGGGPWVINPGSQSLTHLECTPADLPQYDVEAYEVDDGAHPISVVICAAGGAAIGLIGGGGHPAAGAAVPYIIDWLNANDPLDEGSDFDVDVDTYSADQATTNSPCSPEDPPPTGPPPIPMPPGVPSPPGNPGPQVPEPNEVQPDSTYHRYVDSPMNILLAEEHTQPVIKCQYLSRVAFGVDDYHPFGRSARHAGYRFDLLREALTYVDADTLETGPDITMTPGQFAQFQENLRGLLALFAYNAAALAWGEAVTVGLPYWLINQAEGHMNQARDYADYGYYDLSLDYYEQATVMLLEELYPGYLSSLIHGDCNSNGIHDYVEIELGMVTDYNGDGYPDECGSVDVEDREIPGRGTFSLAPVPNPFNPSTELRFRLPAAGDVAIQIFDSSGSLVRTFDLPDQPAGTGSVIWYGRDQQGRALASGLYLVRLRSEDFQATARVTLLK